MNENKDSISQQSDVKCYQSYFWSWRSTIWLKGDGLLGGLHAWENSFGTKQNSYAF